jgi:hypothetical protein
VGYVVFLLAIGGIYFRSLTSFTPVPARRNMIDKKPVNSQQE